MCTVPALVLPWLFSCSWRKHITILTAHQPSEAFLVECQWQPMCRQKWQMIIRLWSLKNQSSYMYKSFSTEHTEHHIITSSHSTHARHRARATFPARGGALPPLLHVLLARVCCSNCGRLLWSLVHVAVHFRLFRERYSPARQQRSPWTLTTVL